MDSINELFTQVLNQQADDIFVQCPCKVVGVNGNFVDVLLYINDEEPDEVIYNVPIQRPETQSAYIFLGIKEGDRGVIRFFDRSVESYLQSDFDYNSDDRKHDINDRCFSLGFIPNKEAFEYLTTAELELGLKSGNCIISIATDGTLNINSTVGANVTAPTVTITGNVIITGNVEVTGTITSSDEITGNNILLSQHTHTGNLGNPTSPPNQ